MTVEWLSPGSPQNRPLGIDLAVTPYSSHGREWVDSVQAER